MAKRKKMFQARQGDVLIVSAAMPSKVTAIDPKTSPRGLVLAEGEATGHAHAIAWPSIATAGIDAKGSLCFAVEGEAAIEHEEHSAITLPTQSYKVIRQREYEPAGVRNVAD